MKMMLVFCIGVLVVASSMVLQAQEIAGLGGAPCSEFLQAAQRSTDSAAPVYFSWSQGFMSSLNLVRLKQHLKAKTLGDSRDYTPAKQLVYLVGYCKRNPTRDFLAATIDLYAHLPSTTAK